MKSRSLFIGYRSSDAAKVDRIARDLTLLRHDDGTPRYTTWQDKHNLPPASPNWWNAIVDAIEKCEVFVFHLSRTSLTSEVCLAELEYAHKRNRPIIPVVLDGEFFLNTVSGKYDLPGETWKLVPEWLRDAQMLFYVETDFYRLFQDALAVFERNWPRDIPAPRPPNPGETGSNHALYSAARDYAGRLAFAEAEKHFDVLVRRNDKDYADVALQWMNVIRLYAELIEIVEHRNPPVIFNRKWAEYTKLFPNDFVEGVFDPRGFAARAAPPASPPPARLSSSMVPALLPAPFAWVEIPGGRGTMATDESNVTLSIPSQTYWMAKYPVTNAQYAKFIEAGGYTRDRWWTRDGQEARRQGIRFDWTGSEWKRVATGKPWVEPRYWTDAQWKGPEQPVVGVSWYEAVAFCRWLSEMTGEKIMLPTEAQWQYAAQGADGRAYPWGNPWDAGRCNNNVDGKGLGRTTPVRQYEGKGDSRLGVVDMAGNVWEWCLTAHETGRNDLDGTDYRVLRGGSWHRTNSGDFRCDFRNRLTPDFWFNVRGFRLALTP